MMMLAENYMEERSVSGNGQLGNEVSSYLVWVLSSACWMFAFIPLLWQSSFKINRCTG